VIALEEARRTVFDACPRMGARKVRLPEALGCVLAAPALARIDVPPFANSGMDGYAVRSEDVVAAPVTLEVVGRVLAGSSLEGAVGPAQAARIMTGAPLPEGADAVCMVELTRPGTEPESVVVEAAVAAGENVRDAGGDVRSGEVVLDAGALVGPTQLAALMSAGCDEVDVLPRPRVGVMSTGDELVESGQPLAGAQIYDSNRPMLLALVAEAGCVPLDLGRSVDDEGALAARIEAAIADVDALVFSGGVSVGDADVVRAVLSKLGRGAGHWMQIAIRPAKPFSFAPLPGPGGPVPAFGLPGNPVSSAVSFELIVRPALLAMAGRQDTERPRCWARAARPLLRRPDGKLHLVRVGLEHTPVAHGPGAGPHGDPLAGVPTDGGEWVVRPAPGQGSHQIRSMALADGLALVPDGDGLGEGEWVEVIVTNPAALAATAATGAAGPVALPAR
jgi:molybdopterin molybdotransferase